MGAEVARAREAWSEALLERGILPFLQEALADPSPRGAIALDGNRDAVRLRGLTDLQEWLARQGIPHESWGAGGSKSVRHLWNEISSGESTLSENPPLRQVAVVSLNIQVGGKQLTEARQLMADGAVRERNSPPTEKMKPGETVTAAALRCVVEELRVDESAVAIAPEPASVAVEELESPSYPGLPSSYRLYTIAAQVRGLPLTSFTTEEAPSGSDATVTTHYWEWR
ncbi:hypothetical protein [Streptomyces sp. NBC_00203]|uniref:hypothetical protein n=1 Tax=Streptomyces sp. NBC_00203 TaxID=2975680 RepID=UPI003246F44C